MCNAFSINISYKGNILGEWDYTTNGGVQIAKYIY